MSRGPNFITWSKAGAGVAAAWSVLALIAPLVEDYPIFPRNEERKLKVDPARLEEQIGDIALRLCPNNNPGEIEAWLYENNNIPVNSRPDTPVTLVTPVC